LIERHLAERVALNRFTTRRRAHCTRSENQGHKRHTERSRQGRSATCAIGLLASESVAGALHA
jgi:hypothetical protein